MSNGKVFSDIAGRYDRLNSLLSLGQDQKWRNTVVSRLPSGRLLDLGAGTGAANELFIHHDVVALDPSPEMLSLNDAQHRVASVGEHLPFEDGSFDAVFSAYVFRNLTSVDATMEEIARVLRPGGVVGIIDLGRPTGRVTSKLHRFGSAVVLPIVGTAVGAREEYVYLNRTLDKHPPPEQLLANAPLTMTNTWRLGPLNFVWATLLQKPT